MIVNTNDRFISKMQNAESNPQLKRMRKKSIEEREELLRLQEIVQEIAKYDDLEKEQLIQNPNIQVVGRVSREVQSRSPKLGDIVAVDTNTQILPTSPRSKTKSLATNTIRSKFSLNIDCMENEEEVLK